MKQRFGRNAVLVLIALLTILFVAWGSKPAHKDFISFWSAGRLIAHHLNPYDQKLVLSVERSQGAPFAKVLAMRNPPWALPLMDCLGDLSARIGLLAWMSATVASVLCVFVSTSPRKRTVFSSSSSLRCMPALLLVKAPRLSCSALCLHRCNCLQAPISGPQPRGRPLLLQSESRSREPRTRLIDLQGVRGAP